MANTAHKGLEAWHRYMEADHDPALLRAMLAPDAVFHSPVVHTPQQGAAKVFGYLSAAAHVFDDSGFHYVRTLIDGNQAMLEFSAEIDGIVINGIDLIVWNDEGLISDFKVMVRPLKAMNMLWQKMAAMLEAQSQNSA